MTNRQKAPKEFVKALANSNFCSNDSRWTSLPPRNPLPPRFKPSVWSRWMGNGPPWRNDRFEDDGLPRMGISRRWKVSFPSHSSVFFLVRVVDCLFVWSLRLVSVSRGEQTYFDASGLPTATEGCKSNALMRCCKDLGIASELWLVLPANFLTRIEVKADSFVRRDPAFIRVFKASHCVEAWTEHASTKKKSVIVVIVGIRSTECNSASQGSKMAKEGQQVRISPRRIQGKLSEKFDVGLFV